MKTPDWQPVELGSIDGFKFVLSFEPEDMSMKYHFINQCGWSLVDYTSIANNYWFVARVTAYKGKIACGDAYLGGNCYKNKKEVLGDFKLTNELPIWDNVQTLLSGYGAQMLQDAITESKQNLEIN
jgi:hypothetical protein